MKKLWAAVLSGLLCLSLSACSAQPAGSRPGDTSGAANSGGETRAASSAAPDEGMTLEEYIEANREQLDAVMGSLEDAGMNMQILARGNSLVYRYQYTTDVGDPAVLKAVMDEMMGSLSSVFESLLETLQLAVPSAESIVVEYLTQDGELITSQEITEGQGEPADSSQTGDEPPAASSAASNEGMTLEEYIEANQETFGQLTESMAASGMNIQILAKGNSLVYRYRYTSDVGTAAQLKPVLDEALESMRSVFENSLEAVRLAVPSAESLVVEYLSQDGEVITSQEYK